MRLLIKTILLWPTLMVVGCGDTTDTPPTDTVTDTVEAPDVATDDTPNTPDGTADVAEGDSTDATFVDTSPSDVAPDTTTATCTDGIKDGVETAVDCGGGVCPACGAGRPCLVATDCTSGLCDDDVCVDFLPRSISEIQTDPSSAACTVAAAGVVTFAAIETTGVVTSPIFMASAGLNGFYIGEATSGPNSGLFVITAASVNLTAVVPGARLKISGAVKEHFCLTELEATTITAVGAETVPAPLAVAPVDAGVEGYEGTFVRMTGLTITDATTAAAGYIKVDGGLQLDIRNFTVGLLTGTTELAWVEGFGHYAFGTYRVEVLRLASVASPCDPNPCANGGTCTPGAGTFTCGCVSGFTGETCATNIDDCTAGSCGGDLMCLDGVNSFVCSGDTCAAPRMLAAADAINGPWTGSGDTTLTGLNHRTVPAGCAALSGSVGAAEGHDEFWTFAAPAGAPANRAYRINVTPTGTADLFVSAYYSDTCTPGTSPTGCAGYDNRATAGGAEQMTAANNLKRITVDSPTVAAGGAYSINVEATCAPSCELTEAASRARVAVPNDNLPVIATSVGNTTNLYNALKVFKCLDASCVRSGSVVLDEDIGGTFGAMHHSLTLGTSNTPVIAYIKNRARQIVLNVDLSDVMLAICGDAQCNPGNTLFRTVATAPMSRNDVAEVAIGGDGAPYVIYEHTLFSGTTGNIIYERSLRSYKCADPDCTSGSTTVIRPLTYEVGQLSMTMGLDGFPLMARRTADGIYTTKCDNAACSSVNTTLLAGDPRFNNFQNVNIAIASNLKPLLTYSLYPTGIGAIACNDASCTDRSAPTTFLPDARLDSGLGMSIIRGFPYLTYSDAGVMTVAKCSTATCLGGTTTIHALDPVVDTDGILGWSTVAKGKYNYPVIVYQALTGGTRSIRVAHPDGLR